MHRIHISHFDAITKAKTPAELRPAIQSAIQLEHATIPAYLCGYFTLKQGTNKAVSDIILGVAIEEMLHMTIASNLLIALGGVPAIDTPGFVPRYPGLLPMGVGGLTVHLRKCSIPQIRDVYMAIEEPDRPITIPSLATPDGVAIATPGYETIGDFYNHIAAKIKEFGDTAFIGDFSKEVVSLKWFPDESDMFRITDTESALRAIDVIVDQGEGSAVDPFDHDGYPAHFYRFEQIVQGNELIHCPGETPPYAFAGAPVAFDATAVWNMEDDPKIENYAPGSRSRHLAEAIRSGLHHAAAGPAPRL